MKGKQETSVSVIIFQRTPPFCVLIFGTKQGDSLKPLLQLLGQLGAKWFILEGQLGAK